MKPKNRVYCRECGKLKILFETEQKALNFLKYNAKDIINKKGYTPKRVYYCECCGGYHVTHCIRNYKPYTTQEIIDAYKTEQENG